MGAYMCSDTEENIIIMIIISTYNGFQYLKNLLSDLESFNIPNNIIYIVDNKSTNEEHLTYLERLKQHNYNILYNPINSFEIGAYKYAIDNGIDSEHYFFIQDSIRIKENIFSKVIPKLDNNNIYTFLTFTTGIYDSNYDNTFLRLNFGDNYYPKGIFGNMFFANKNVVQKIKDELIIPKSKLDSMGMERGLSKIFYNHKIQINGLDIYVPAKTTDPSGYMFFQKIYASR